MRILHVVPSYLPAIRYGGPIISVHGLCKALAKRGHDVEVFTTNVDGPENSDVPLGQPVDLEGVKVWYFPSRRLRRLYWSPPMAKALAAQAAKFDLLHLHSIYLWPTWAAARTARKAKVPHIVTPRGMLVKELIKRKSRLVKFTWIQLIERRNLENASAIHMTSILEGTESARFGFRLPPIFIVPNGVDREPSESVARLSPRMDGLLEQKLLLVFLGRINWKKGLDRLIVALSYVPEAHLAIVGNDEEDYQPTLVALAEAHRVRERITFTGPVYGMEKEALLEHAAALVLPSYSENFGIVVLEAMAAGCPVVVTPEVGAADIVHESGAGLVVEGEPDILGNSIEHLLSDPRRRAEMGARGKETVSERFSWDAVARKTEEVYRGILRGGGISGTEVQSGSYRKTS